MVCKFDKVRDGDFLIEGASLDMAGKVALNLDEVLKRRREARDLEFKVCFDPGRAQDWCELTKDIKISWLWPIQWAAV